MINFPVLERLDISGYGLYPGPEGGNGGLHVHFNPGLTLVLGSNGLGKTTLVNIIYRMLTGPYDIPGLAGRTDLGTTRLTPAALSNSNRSVFAQRVVDGARGATARLSFRLGADAVVVERRLHDLSLVHFAVNGEVRPTDEVHSFQSTIRDLVGLWSFGDWILLLRHIVFYFEDRRALVWDASAQRQLLRMIFLPASTAQKWTEDERAILELDSRARNLHAALYREEKALAETEVKTANLNDVVQELQSLEEVQAIDVDRREQLGGELPETQTAREDARLRLLTAEQEREAFYRRIEQVKLAAIEACFPDSSETARYILSHILTERDCLVCGQEVPGAAAEYEARIERRQCVVCGSMLPARNESAGGAVRNEQPLQMEDAAALEQDVGEAREGLVEKEAQYRAVTTELATLDRNISARSQRIDALVRRLPPEEAEIHRQRSELSVMRGRVEELRGQLTAQREAFRGFVNEVSRELVKWSEDVKRSFDAFAEGFLLERCRLLWSPQKARIGETGELIDFPAFELELTGTTFPSPVRRGGPEQVSESQREFIDLAFRMALMEIGGSSKGGSLVIDAPESSLDAVFVRRAANVLSRFADPNRENRLLVTTNLTEGALIPDLLASCTTPSDRSERIVDLFEIAAPTAAVRELRAEYDSVRVALMSGQHREEPQ